MTRAHWTVEQLRRHSVRLLKNEPPAVLCPNEAGHPWTGNVPLSTIVPELAADPERKPSANELLLIAGAMLDLHDFARQKWLEANPAGDEPARVHEALNGARDERLRSEKTARDSARDRKLSVEALCEFLRSNPKRHDQSLSDWVLDASVALDVAESTVWRRWKELPPVG